MKHLKLVIMLAVVAFVYSCKKGNETKTSAMAYSTEAKTDANGYSYETVANDPTGLRLYTLDNGLKVYMSKKHR